MAGGVEARLLTAASPGAIAVIGLAGEGAAELLRAATRRRKANESPEFPTNKLVLCRVVDGEETLDDAICVAWDDGRTAELCLHGGVRIVQRVMLLLERMGARRAEGEPPAADPTEAAIDAALMKAETRRMTQWLLAQRRILPAFLREQAGRSPDDPDFERRSAVAAKLVRGLHVAIVGPPNAGKSTLANRLIGRERVITSDIPGTTRDWVSETASVGGWPITLTDTAGIRGTPDAIEREAIARGTHVARRADLVLIVLDATRDEAALRDELAHIEATLAVDSSRLVVLNKIDRLETTERRWSQTDAIGVSALSGERIDALEAATVERLGLDLLRDDRPARIGAPISEPAINQESSKNER